jgi:signal peptide peptidase SppA
MTSALLNRSPLLDSVALQPMLIREDGAALFQSSIAHVEKDERCSAEINHPSAAAVSDEEFWGSGEDDDWRTYYRPYTVIEGVLQIPVMGTLLAKFSYSFGRWATGYKYIEMALKRGLDDYNVKGIALVIDSPGGMVTDCFELCEKILAARDVKPIRAFAADSAYSAAYAIACCASTVIVTRSGGVGSIGVVTVHISYADAIAKAGMEVTFIFAGDHKVDGNPYEKLKPAVKARIAARINKIYVVFTSHVATARGMDVEDVVATQALTYDAQDGIDVGLADRLGALEEEMVTFTSEVNEDGDAYMAQPNVTGQKPGTEDTGIDQATYDKGVADAKAAGYAEGLTAGATAQLDRINAIMGSDEAKTRPVAAKQVAMASNMTLDQAKGFLAGMPEEKPVVATAEQKPAPVAGKIEGRNHFAEAMNNGQQPNVGSGEDETQEDSAEAKTDKSVNSILASYGNEAGISKKKSA